MLTEGRDHDGTVPGVPLSTALIRHCSNHRHENSTLAQLRCLYHRAKGMARDTGRDRRERDGAREREREGERPQSTMQEGDQKEGGWGRGRREGERDRERDRDR